MTLDEAIGLQIERTGNPRFGWLCSDDNPDSESRDSYRDFVLRQATGQSDPQPRQTVTAAVGHAPLIPIPLGGCCH